MELSSDIRDTNLVNTAMFSVTHKEWCNFCQNPGRGAKLVPVFPNQVKMMAKT